MNNLLERGFVMGSVVGYALKKIKEERNISKFYDLKCFSPLIREAIEANFDETNQNEIELLNYDFYHKNIYLYYRVNENRERTSNFPLVIVIGNTIYALKERKPGE